MKRIRDFLHEELENEPGLIACLMIHTLNRNKEKVFVKNRLHLPSMLKYFTNQYVTLVIVTSFCKTGSPHHLDECSCKTACVFYTIMHSAMTNENSGSSFQILQIFTYINGFFRIHTIGFEVCFMEE